MSGCIRTAVTLNDNEQRIAAHIAKMRHGTNEANGVANQRACDRPDLELHRDGFGAELAFCKLFNVYPEFDTASRRGGADCDYFGVEIDVKTTTYPDGHLLAWARKKELATDWYVLFVIEWPVYTFVGFAPAAEVFAPERLTDLGYGATYALPQHALRASLLARKDSE